MQCMSTVAVVRRETGGWKWPAIQFAYMTLLAYVCALITNQVVRSGIFTLTAHR
jgi:ferrous iron transport protein B